MEIGLWAAVLQGPVGLAAGDVFDHGAYAQVPGRGSGQDIAVNEGNQAKTIVRYLASNRGRRGELGRRDHLAIRFKGVAGPVTIGGKIEFEVAPLPLCGDEDFATGLLPQAIPALSIFLPAFLPRVLLGKADLNRVEMRVVGQTQEGWVEREIDVNASIHGWVAVGMGLQGHALVSDVDAGWGGRHFGQRR